MDAELYLELLPSGEKVWMDALAAILLYLKGEARIATHLPGFARPDWRETQVREIIRLIRQIQEQSVSEEMRRLVLQRNAEFENKYSEMRQHFDLMKKVILASVVSLQNLHGGEAQDYDAIIRHIQADHPSWKAETIPRRIRELKSEGSLVEPGRGRFAVATQAVR